MPILEVFWVYQLRLKDDSLVILKIPFDEKRWKRECYFLERLQGIIPVPKVIKTLEPSEKLSGAIVMEYLSGHFVLPKLLTNVIAFRMGALLAALHSVPCECYGDIAKDLCLPATFVSGLSLLEEHFYRSLEECKKHVQSSFLRNVERLFREEIEKIESLDGPCITHCDFIPKQLQELVFGQFQSFRNLIILSDLSINNMGLFKIVKFRC
jgi:aminoglycoside phosphotransferase (APT) family kinase protein